MPGRLIAIGDIHGCSAAFDAVLAGIAPGADDTIITLGDYVDRGPDSSGVLDRLGALARQTHLVALLGNHDEMMLKVYDGRRDLFADWLVYGGSATLASYHAILPTGIRPEHVALLRSLPLFYEAEHHFFVHANYQTDVPLGEQPREVLLWESLRNRVPGPHYSGKIAILAHTAQKTGQILNLGHLKCIDTWCYGEGCLTALDVLGGEVWQADKTGKRR